MLCWPCFSKSDNYLKDFLVAQRVKNLPVMQGTQVRTLGQEDPLEKWMATHSCILAWRVPRTEEPGGLQSMGSQSIDTTEWQTLSELSVILLCCQPHCPGCGKEFGFLGPPHALLNLGWSQESLPHLLPDSGLVNKRAQGLCVRRHPGSTGHISCPRDVTDWDEDLLWFSSPFLLFSPSWSRNAGSGQTEKGLVDLGSCRNIGSQSQAGHKWWRKIVSGGQHNYRKSQARLRRRLEFQVWEMMQISRLWWVQFRHR